MKALLRPLLCAVFAIALDPAALHAQVQTPAQAASETRAEVSKIEDVAALIRMARQFESQASWARAAIVWRRLAALSPHNPNYLYNLAVNYALADEKSEAYNVLLATQQAGLGFDLEGESRFANLHGTEVWDYLVKLHKSAAGDAFGEGSIAFEIPPADRLLESIAHDPETGAFLLGSARDGVIYRRGKDGELDEWAQPQGDMWWSIFDIKVDSARKVVWATSAAVPHFKGYRAEWAGRSSLLKIGLADGKLIAAYPAPQDGLPHILNSIAVSSRGLVIVSEGMRGQLFKLEGDALQPLMAEPKLNALRGIVFSPDDRVLYFADYERGLFGLDLSRSTAFDVSYKGNAILYGIEGLYMYDGQLVAIQNGIRPQRVMRFKLADEGRTIEMGVPIESANDAFATPTLGTIVDDQLYYIANSQRGYYDGYGLLKGSRELPPTKVFKSNIRFNWDFKPPSLPASVGPRASEPAPDGGQ
jgi:hypothetical protein